jgi:hypothetical protein
MNCSICEGKIEIQRTPEGKVYWDQGHNADPVTDGRCCETCNVTKVIPARMARIVGKVAVPQQRTDLKLIGEGGGRPHTNWAKVHQDEVFMTGSLPLNEQFNLMENEMETFKDKSNVSEKVSIIKRRTLRRK